MPTLTEQAANAQAEAMKSHLEGGRLDVLASGVVLTTFVIAALTQASGGQIRTISEMVGFARIGGKPTAYAAFSKDGQPLFGGSAQELGLDDSLIQEGSRVIVSGFSYLIPHG